MSETSNECHQRLAITAAATWKEVVDLMAKDPGMGDVRNQDLLFRLLPAAEQAAWVYWKKIDAEDCDGSQLLGLNGSKNTVAGRAPLGF